MLYSVLKKVNFKGKISIIDSSDKINEFGSGSNNLKIKLTNKSIEKKLFRNPSLYFGEGYMNEEILIIDGTIDQLIDLITYRYLKIDQHTLIQERQ